MARLTNSRTVHAPARLCQAGGRAVVIAMALALGRPATTAAQLPPDLAAERTEFARWLASAPLSPYAILALQPVGDGISIGAEPSDIPLPIARRGIAREERGVVTLVDGPTRLPLPRGRPVRLEQFTLLASGAPSRSVVAAYGAVRRYRPPVYFDHAPALSFTTRLEPPERRGRFRTLGLDGAETEASEAGFVTLSLGGVAARLRVYRLGADDDPEQELAIFFRDRTSGKESYPAGRFLLLEPVAGGSYRVDFNRARNPFCAYSSVYPCPAPWPGNQIAAGVAAGEQYAHAALEPAP